MKYLLIGLAIATPVCAQPDAVMRPKAPKPAAHVTSGLSNVRAYPNPFRVDQHTVREIKFDQMPNESTVKIFTVSGQLVKSLDATTGQATWNLQNDSGETVASGVYLYLVTDSQGHEHKGKLAVLQ
jgi:hypothetical protein